MPETWPNDLSKAGQLARSPGGNRRCKKSGQLKAECEGIECRNYRNRKSGDKAQRKVIKKSAKVLGESPAQYAGQLGNEEALRLSARLEIKSGDQAGPVVGFYLRTKLQAQKDKPIGDWRPFIAAAEANGITLWVVRPEDLESIFADQRQGKL